MPKTTRFTFVNLAKATFTFLFASLLAGLSPSTAHAFLTTEFMAIGNPITGASIHLLEDDPENLLRSDLFKFYNSLRVGIRQNIDGSVGKEFFTISQELVGGFSGGCSYFERQKIDCTLFVFNAPGLPNTKVSVDARNRMVTLSSSAPDALPMIKLFTNDPHQTISSTFTGGVISFATTPMQFDFRFKAPPRPTPTPAPKKSTRPN